MDARRTRSAIYAKSKSKMSSLKTGAAGFWRGSGSRLRDRLRLCDRLRVLCSGLADGERVSERAREEEADGVVRDEAELEAGLFDNDFGCCDFACCCLAGAVCAGFVGLLGCFEAAAA